MKNESQVITEDSLFEQMATITKAHAYDILREQVKELDEQNKSLKKAIIDVLEEITKMDKHEVINSPALIIGRISDICTETFKLRPL